MATFLHLVKADSALLAASVIESNAREAGADVTVILLDHAVPPALPSTVLVRRLAADDVDYAGLLDLIFESDHVITW
jgi:hypothetical protein